MNISYVVRTLSRLETCDDVLHWASRRFEELGEGADRCAFAIDDRYVLKVSIAGSNQQNKNEVLLWNRTRAQCLAQVFFYDEGYDWLIQERLPETPPKCGIEGGKTRLLEAFEDKFGIDLYDSFSPYYGMQYCQARYISGRGNVLYDYGMYFKTGDNA